MNVFDLIIPAISQSLSGQNWLLGLIFAAVVTALIGLVIGWLWGRAWNAAWTPWASTLPTIVVSSLMVVIFGSLLTLHGLTSEHFGFASLKDIPSLKMIEHAINAGEDKGQDAKTSLENSNYFTPVVEFCWNRAASMTPVAGKTPQAQANGDQQGQSTKDLREHAKQLREKMKSDAQKAFMTNLASILEQYKAAYYTVLVLFLTTLALMMLAIASLAYLDIKLVPIHPDITKFQHKEENQA